MRILDKYITREFLRYYFLFALFFVAIFVLTEFFSSISDLKEEARILHVIFYYLLQIPYHFIILSPLSVIVSALFTTSYFSATNQLQAVQISGISGKRAVLPLLTAGLIISFCCLFIDNTLVYYANSLSHQIKEHSFKGISSQNETQKNIFIAVPPDYVFYIRLFNFEKSLMESVLIYENSSPPVLISAQQMRWKDGVWVLEEGKEYTLGEELKEISFARKILPITKEPAYFTRAYLSPEKMNISALIEHIEEYRKSGFKTANLKTELQFKISSPFANFILILIAVSLGVMLKRGGKGASLALGLLMSFGYYEMTAFFKSMGKAQVMNPFFAAWLPNVLFLIGGIYLIRKME